MRNRSKFIALLVVFVFGFTMVLTGCGSSSGSTLEVKSTASDTTVAAASTTASDATATPSQTGEKKKVAIVMDTDDPWAIDSVNQTIKTLKDAGYEDGKNLEITRFDMHADAAKSQEVVDSIKSLKPDVAILHVERFYDSVQKPLEGTGIPVVVFTVDGYYNTNSMLPNKNITGVTSMPGDIQQNGYTILNKISPINKKKAVFITTPIPYFNKEKIEKDLKALNIELKEYKEATYFEDFKPFIEKYNKDNEVGWILVGVWPSLSKDNPKWTTADIGKWDIENRTKPCVTYWDVAVQMGMLVGLAVDIPTVGSQQGEMAAKILNGEKVETIKVQDPRKINVVVNKMTADRLGIKIPLDILGGAKIYTDYAGHTAG